MADDPSQLESQLNTVQFILLNQSRNVMPNFIMTYH